MPVPPAIFLACDQDWAKVNDIAWQPTLSTV